MAHKTLVTVQVTNRRPWRPAEGERAAAVLMSGGVDSSLAAALLREAGYTLLGATLRLPTLDPAAQPSRAEHDAAQVARHLDIPHVVLDVRAAFHARVVQAFRAAYRQGRTPNPCILCNASIKFGLAWDVLESRFGVRKLATGHYARTDTLDGRALLARAADVVRDQTYFLYRLPVHRVGDALFPLGELTKPEARRRAQALELGAADRPDSMELCFAGTADYRALLDRTDLGTRGPVLDTTGRELGRHQGIGGYTVGQRRGLGTDPGGPWYVLRIDPDRNALIVGTREQASCAQVRTRALHVFRPERLAAGARVWGKIRSLADPEPCVVERADDQGLVVRFDAPQFAPTPGQHLVLYDQGGRVLGGGEIQ